MIRKAKRKDYLSICELATNLHNIHHELRPEHYRKVNCAMELEKFQELIEEERIIILEKQKHILGYAEIEIKKQGSNLECDATIFHIRSLIIKEPYRANGLGKEFFKELETYAKKKNCTQIQLLADEENKRAQKFYETIGLKVQTLKYEKKW